MEIEKVNPLKFDLRIMLSYDEAEMLLKDIESNIKDIYVNSTLDDLVKHLNKLKN